MNNQRNHSVFHGRTSRPCLLTVAFLGILGLTGCNESSKTSSASSSSSAPSAVQTLSDLQNGKAASFTIKDGFDGKIAYTLQFSNGVMRLKDADSGIVAYEGPANTRQDFDTTCIGGETVMFGSMKNGFYLCTAVHSFEHLGLSSKGQKYPVKVESNTLFYRRIPYDSPHDKFPGNKDWNATNGLFYGKLN